MQGYCSTPHYHAQWRADRRAKRLAENPKPPCAREGCTEVARVRYCSDECADAVGYQVLLETQKQRRATDEEFRKAANARAAAWRDANPDRARELYQNRDERKYGLVPGEYAVLSAHRDGACWICEKVPVEKAPSGQLRRLHIDHDPRGERGEPGYVRGLGCSWCNPRLWAVEEEGLRERVEAYLHSYAAFQPPAPEGRAATGKGHRDLGLTQSQVNAILEAAGGLCSCCGQEERRTMKQGVVLALSIDHDHSKKPGDLGFIRGPLCNRCNIAVGLYENTTWWAAAERYLVEGPARVTEILEAHRASPDACPEKPPRRPRIRKRGAERALSRGKGRRSEGV